MKAFLLIFLSLFSLSSSRLPPRLLNQNIFPRERVSEFMPVGVLLPVKNWYS